MGMSDNNYSLLLNIGGIVIAVGILIILLSMVIQVKKRFFNNKDKTKVSKTEYNLYKIASKRKKIDEGFIKNSLGDIVKTLIYGIYANQSDYIPWNNLTDTVAYNIREKFTQNASLGIQRTVTSYEMDDIKVESQTDDFVSDVSIVELSAKIHVSYVQNTSVQTHTVSKRFRQSVVFKGLNDKWEITDILQEQDVALQNLPTGINI